MKSLASFISEGPEEKKLDKLRVLVLAIKYEDKTYARTTKRISEESKKLGHEIFIVNILGAFIRYEEGTYKIFNSRFFMICTWY